MEGDESLEWFGMMFIWYFRVEWWYVKLKDDYVDDVDNDDYSII